jgi:hypothetical protein
VTGKSRLDKLKHDLLACISGLRKHFRGIVEQPKSMEFPGRSFETGTICNALACGGVEAPHTRKPYSEALLLGVSGGIAAGYMVFQYKGWPAHVALLTRNTFNPYRTVIDRLGIIEDTKETVDAKRGLANLIESIESGSPTIVWADVLSLPYTNAPANQNMWAVMPMVVHSYDGASFHLADRSKVEGFRRRADGGAGAGEEGPFSNRDSMPA